MQGPNAVLNTITLPPGATQAQARLVLDGVRGAIFVYNNGGPVGALIGSWAIKAGTDPYGNAYPQGLSVDIGSLTGVELLLYSTTPPTQNNLLVSVSGIQTTDQFGDQVLQGITVYSATTALNFALGGIAFYTAANQQVGWGVSNTVIGFGNGMSFTSPADMDFAAIGNFIFNPGAFILFNTGTPATPAVGGSTIWSNAQGWLGVMPPSGLTYMIPGTTSNTTPLTNANGAGPLRLTDIYTIPANDLVLGTVYTLEAPWLATMNGNTLELGLSINGAGAFAASATIGGAIVGGGASINGSTKLKLICTGTGAAGSLNVSVSGEVFATGVNVLFTNSTGYITTTTGVAIDTTVSNTIRINSLWGGTSAVQTVTAFDSVLSRMAE